MSGDLDNPTTEADGQRRADWPTSAVVTVVALGLLIAVLVLMNVFVKRPFGGPYEANTTGSMADWFAGFAALLAVPIALWISSRNRADDRRAFLAEQLDRRNRSDRELRQLRDGLRLEVATVPVVDAAMLGGGIDIELLERWRAEMRVRGWVPDPDDPEEWVRNEAHVTTRQLVEIEPTPLLPKPWTLMAVCRNHGTSTVQVRTLTMSGKTGAEYSVEVADPELSPSDARKIRIYQPDAKPLVFKSAKQARAFVTRAIAQVEDSSGRRVTLTAVSDRSEP